MINQTLNLTIDKSYQIVLNSFETHTYVYVGFLLFFLLFLIKVLGSEISDDKDDKILYGTLILIPAMYFFLLIYLIQLIKNKLLTIILLILILLHIFVLLINMYSYKGMFNNINTIYKFQKNKLKEIQMYLFRNKKKIITFFLIDIILMGASTIMITSILNEGLIIIMLVIYLLFKILLFFKGIHFNMDFNYGKLYIKDKKTPIKFKNKESHSDVLKIITDEKNSKLLIFPFSQIEKVEYYIKNNKSKNKIKN